MPQGRISLGASCMQMVTSDFDAEGKQQQMRPFFFSSSLTPHISPVVGLFVLPPLNFSALV